MPIHAVVLAALALGAAPAQHHVDLATGTVDGQTVLGKTMPEVVLALGRPDFRQRAGARSVIGWGTSRNFSAEIFFSGPTRRAHLVVFERGAVVDAKIGDILAKTPARLQSALVTTYAGVLEETRALMCTKSRCVGEFAAVDGSHHVSFGRTLSRGTYATIWG